MVMMRSDHAEFAASLAAERAAVSSFVDILKKEQDALVRRDTDRIGAEIEDKSQLLLKLSQFAARRSRFLAMHALTADRKGMASWFASHPEASGMLEDWEELLILTRTAARLNHANGVLIEAALRANQMALSALVSASQTGSLYGPGGETLATHSPRSLGAV